jgi:hypothetical protein
MLGVFRAVGIVGSFQAILIILIVLLGVPIARGGVNCVADAAGCCCVGMRGNVDCDNDDLVDIADLTLLIDHLYLSLEPLPSVDEANVDGLEGIDIADVTRLVDYMYISLSPLPGCPGPINHPPVTRLNSIDDTKPVINAVGPGLPGTPILVSWGGDDKLDHPYEPPPIRFEWRVYGPYDSLTFLAVKSQFQKQVFVTAQRQMFYFGHGDRIVTCDTVWIQDTLVWPLVVCDTLLIDTITYSSLLGTIDTIFDVSSPAFRQNPAYDRIAARSGDVTDYTVLDTSTTLYNLFHNDVNDTTVEKYFVFWVCAQDPDDAALTDPTPPYRILRVFDPKFERAVLIADAERQYEVNPRNKSKATAYWNAAIPRWNSAVTPDFHTISQVQGNVLPMKALLQHKVVIVLNDDAIFGVLPTPGVEKNLLAAASAGASIWFCGRCLFYGMENGPPLLHVSASLYGVDKFGLTELRSTGWHYYALGFVSTPIRIEDFCGADAVDSTRWPNLSIDTNYLHSRYVWGDDYFPWIPSLAALPEVDYWSLAPEAEALYSYRSIYTDHHPLRPDSFFYVGKPVVCRLTQTHSRLMFSAFTPYAMSGDSVGGAAQMFIDSVMSWLSEPFETGFQNSTPAISARNGLSKERGDAPPPEVVGAVRGKQR